MSQEIFCFWIASESSGSSNVTVLLRNLWRIFEEMVLEFGNSTGRYLVRVYWNILILDFLLYTHRGQLLINTYTCGRLISSFLSPGHYPELTVVVFIGSLGQSVQKIKTSPFIFFKQKISKILKKLENTWEYILELNLTLCWI